MLKNIFLKLVTNINLLEYNPEITDSNFCARAAGVMKLLGRVIEIFQVVVPVIVVLFAMIDLGKAVVAGEEKEIKTAQKMLIKRLIFGCLLFLTVTMVKSVFGLVQEAVDVSINSTCWECVMKPDSCDLTCVENPELAECKPKS